MGRRPPRNARPKDANPTNARTLSRLALHAAQARATLRKRGKGIGPYDTLIAGQALALGVRLTTAPPLHKTRHPPHGTRYWRPPAVYPNGSTRRTPAKRSKSRSLL